tara:strand:- start:214 stop:681 length:468 start_codon:yes stop_codon:yes gene_type:complete
MNKKEYIESQLDVLILERSFIVVAEKKPSKKYNITFSLAISNIFKFLQDKGFTDFQARAREIGVSLDDLIKNSPRYYGVALYYLVYDLQTMSVKMQRETIASAFKIKKASFCCFLQQALHHPHQKNRNAKNRRIHAIYKSLIYKRKGAQPKLNNS